MYEWHAWPLLWHNGVKDGGLTHIKFQTFCSDWFLDKSYSNNMASCVWLGCLFAAKALVNLDFLQLRFRDNMSLPQRHILSPVCDPFPSLVANYAPHWMRKKERNNSFGTFLLSTHIKLLRWSVKIAIHAIYKNCWITYPFNFNDNFFIKKLKRKLFHAQIWRWTRMFLRRVFNDDFCAVRETGLQTQWHLLC